MEKQEKQDLDQTPAQPSEPGRVEEAESIYKGLENVPLKVLDIIIGLCIAAFVITIAVGFLNR